MAVNFHCKICCKPVVKNDDNIKCDKCNTYVQRNCDKINKQTYRQPQNNETSYWYCIIGTKEFVPLSTLNNNEFI